jgi:hypothetical protein
VPFGSDRATTGLENVIIQKITAHLWFTDKAEEAARFYASIFPNSRVDRVATSPADSVVLGDSDTPASLGIEISRTELSGEMEIRPRSKATPIDRHAAASKN